MKLLNLIVLLVASSSAAPSKDKSPKPSPPICPSPFTVINSKIKNDAVVDYKHYLVGLLNFPQTEIPDILNGHTSGVKARAAFETPLDPLAYVPNVGITDIEPYVIYVPELNAFIKVSGEFYTLVDEGYGTSDVSEDYALHYHQMEIKKPMVYNHAEKTFDVYTPVNRKATYLIHDPHKLIGWKSEWDGHALDIQVTYEAPDDWDDYKELRVLTGRDFSPEGMAVFQHNCSVVADKWNPSIFSMDPMTGVVTSGLVNVPDIVNASVTLLSDKLLTTVSDKRHCYAQELVAGLCGIVEDDRVDSNGYYEYVKNSGKGGKEKVFVPKFKKIGPDDGFVGLALMASNNIAGFFQATLAGEAGPRIYEIYGGNCTGNCAPAITKFIGFYHLSHNANRIAAVTPIPGSESRVLVMEHTSGFPDGLDFPRSMPADKLCIVNIRTAPAIDAYNFNLVKGEKICILNYMHIADPYDVDQNGLGVYAQSQKSNSGLIIVDDYCFIGGTDPNWPFGDDYSIQDTTLEFYTEAIVDTRFFIVCYYEPIFDAGFHLPGFTDLV